MMTDRELLSKLIKRLEYVNLGVETDEITGYLCARLSAEDDGLDFWPIAPQGWRIGRRYYRDEGPDGLKLLWQAVRAYYEDTPADLLPKSAWHKAGKSLGYIQRWAKQRFGAERLSLVAECTRMSGGRPVFVPLPGVPEVRYKRPA